MFSKLTPIQILTFGYAVLILMGAILLSLPFASALNQYTNFVDSAFTAASAVSTTGLAVYDTGSYYSIPGQIIILILIQIGGLGYMIFVASISFGLGSNLSLNGKKLLAESISRPSGIELKKFIKLVIIFTSVIELFGAVTLTVIFAKDQPLDSALYSAIFHSISAFCTAGFSLYSSSFVSYSNESFINIIIAILSITGGIGFFVLYDVSKYFKNIYQNKYPRRLSSHTKLVLWVTSLLIVVSCIIIFIAEGNHNQPQSFYDRILTSSFQAISASTTTGFNSVEISLMKPLSLFIIVIVMFIGASPGGTGGGIKTSTFGVVLLFLLKILRNKNEIHSFRRSVTDSTVNKALGITIFGSFYLTTIVFVLFASENFSLLQIIFETTSALGTVGLSMGVTSSLSVFGKLLITLTMLVGRVGPLAIAYSIVGKIKSTNYSYPTGNVMAG
ncbi:MAG: hypothetical protein KF816_00370 [Melioribacteraceae bacterium]|jgi:trk system potassium uptake protein TrkH|nr:hypothetical protein [Melioribacteraceae bacterium]